MLKERDTILCLHNVTRGKSLFLTSFFMAHLFPKATEYDYNDVRRWTKNIDIFEYDKIFIPINISNGHWTLAVISMQLLEIKYYDSLNGNGMNYKNVLQRWVGDEAADKKNILDYDVSQINLNPNMPAVPQQSNYVDCGVFTIVCADFLSDNLNLSYNQTNIPLFRNKIGMSIIRGSLNY